MRFPNLHLHTYFSDGALSPAALFNQVLAHPDVSHFSINDHDTLSGIEPMLRAVETARASGAFVPHFIPGVELSLEEPTTGLYVHVLGYFPWINSGNARRELPRLDAALGDYCRKQCEMRGRLDIDGRLEYIWRENLDDVRSQYPSFEPIRGFLYARETERIGRQTQESAKPGDIIQHPIPMTYQCLTEYWQALIPNSLSEIMMLYIVRQEKPKIDRLTELLNLTGRSDARAIAEKYQGALSLERYPGAEYASIFEGLEMIHSAGGIAVLAHPAVACKRFSYAEYDAIVTRPLIDAGLDGIEVWYPYNKSFRDEAVEHYSSLAESNRLLSTGGTDYHGDGRSRIDDMVPPVSAAERLLEKGSRSPNL